jgi:hypothetical protein
MGIHLNDVGTSFRGTAKRYEDGTVLDVSTANELIFRFVKPQGDIIDRNVSFVTNGIDGKIEYITIDGDLDQMGRWSIQLIIQFSNSKWHSDIHTFLVGRNL